LVRKELENLEYFNKTLYLYGFISCFASFFISNFLFNAWFEKGLCLIALSEITIFREKEANPIIIVIFHFLLIIMILSFYFMEKKLKYMYY